MRSSFNAKQNNIPTEIIKYHFTKIDFMCWSLFVNIIKLAGFNNFDCFQVNSEHFWRPN